MSNQTPALYLRKITKQVFSECASWSTEQIMPLVIGFIGAWLAIQLGLVTVPQGRAEYETVIFGFLLAFPIYLLWQVIRAPYILDCENLRRIDELDAQNKSALAALAPKLTIDFDPRDRQFLEITRIEKTYFDANRGALGVKSESVIFIHVRPRCLCPSVPNCRGFLTEIATWSGKHWESVFARSVPLFWAGQEDGPEPLTLYENVPQFLDIAYAYEGENFIHLLHPRAPLPNSMPQTVGPMDIFV